MPPETTAMATPMRMSARKLEVSCFAYRLRWGNLEGHHRVQACMWSPSGWALLLNSVKHEHNP